MCRIEILKTFSNNFNCPGNSGKNKASEHVPFFAVKRDLIVHSVRCDNTKNMLRATAGVAR